MLRHVIHLSRLLRPPPGPRPALPPGQTLVDDWPVLTAGPTPRSRPTTGRSPSRPRRAPSTGAGTRSRTSAWKTSSPTSTASLTGRSSRRRGAECRSTSCSRTWRPDDYVMAHSYGGYTTNVPLEDLLNGQAWIASESEGEPLDPEHGGPGASARAASVLLEERQVGPRNTMMPERRARVLGAERIPHVRRPLAGGALLVNLRRMARRHRRRDAHRDPLRPAHRARRAGWPGNDAGRTWMFASPRPTAIRRCGRTRSPRPAGTTGPARGRRASRRRGVALPRARAASG